MNMATRKRFKRDYIKEKDNMYHNHIVEYFIIGSVLL